MVAEIHGDGNNPNQYHVIYQKDALARAIGKIIDPATPDSPNGHLVLTTTNALDRQGRVVKHTDPKGEVYRLFYDLNGHKRFKVVANGGVQEWRYDAMQREHYHCLYGQAITANDQTTLADLVEFSRSHADASQDKVTLHFRDANGDVSFRIKLAYHVKAGQTQGVLKGIVQAHEYDHNRRLIRQTIYATLIDVDGIDTFTIQSLQTLMATKADPAYDRTIYKFYNPAGDCCFSINAKGQLQEDRFDADKRITRSIHYTTPIIDINAWLSLPFDEFQAKVKTLADVHKDQYQAHGFDAFGKPLYTVNAIGKVIRFEHDKNNNLTQEIQFDKSLYPVPNDDAALKAAVIALIPDPNTDRIKRYAYNAVDSQVKIIDQMNQEDVFERDALNNIKSHQNREKQKTLFEYDRAKRQILTTAPAKPVTAVALTPEGKLNPTKVTRAVKTKREYDNNNNLQTLIADFQGDQQRIVTNTYTPLNGLQTVTVPSVSIDDPSKAASLDADAWPVEQKDVVRSALYNAKGLLSVEIDEGRHYRFKIYDNLNRLRFLVTQEKEGQDTVLCSVSGYEYNAFGDKVWETHYATCILVDINQAKENGLNVIEVAKQLQSTQQDQVKWYDYNKNSEWTHRVTGIIRNPNDSKTASSFYYNPTTQDIGTHYRLMQRRLNLFGYPELISTLISPTPETWQHQRIMYDQNNKPMVEAVTQRDQLTSAPAFHVKTTKRNIHQEIIESKDFYTLCPLKLNDLSVPYEDVMAFYVNPEHRKDGFDKIKTYEYTRQGKKASRTLKNISWASLELSDPKNPSVNHHLTDATECFDYTAIEKVKTHQLANSATEYYFHNAAGELIAHAAQPRQLASHSDTAIIPLKLIGVNAHGQAVADSRYINGAALQSNIPTPNPAQTSPDDQTILKLMDASRGLTIAEQNSRGIVKKSTFNATKQKSREWQTLTTRIVPKTLIAETVFLTDARGRIYGKLWKEDHQLIQATYKQFSPFGDEILEGPDNVAWPLYREQDNSGRTWKSNEKKVSTILLHDLRANVTAEMVAQSTDVKALAYDQIIPLLKNAAENYQDIEITHLLRDENSRILKKLLPRATPSLIPVLKNIPVQMVFHAKDKTISWVLPEASNVAMVFSYWTDSVAIQQLPIVEDNGRCVVDVSGLTTDLYDYRIDYSLKPPKSADSYAIPTPKQAAALLYQTTGTVGVITAKQNGQRVVAHIGDDHVLYLAGVNNLAEVTIRQELTEKGTFPLKWVEGYYRVDLASLDSGCYTAEAITSVRVSLPASLPFMINTALAPQMPLAREIPASSQLMTFNQYGQLTLWESLPKDYQLNKAIVRIEYLDQTDSLQVEHFVIDPTQPTTKQRDADDHEIDVNICFKAAVKEIKDWDIQLMVGDDRVMLYKDAVPTGSQDSHVAHVWLGRRGRVESTSVLTHVGRMQATLPKDWQDDNAEAKDSWQLLKAAGLPAKHQLLAEHEAVSVLHVDLDPTKVITWSCPPIRIAWIRGVNQTYPTPPTLSYLDVSAGHLASWKDIASLAVTTRGIVVDVTGFPPGNYPYIFEGGDKTKALTLSLAAGGDLYSSASADLPMPDASLRHVDYLCDVRGNAIRETQADGAQYDRRFSLDNQLLSETGPVISVQDQAGNINDAFRPTTLRLYDIRGIFFGTQLPVGNLEVYVLNATGDKLQYLLGDGTVKDSFTLDGFGRRVQYTLANGAVFIREYNQSNKLIRYQIPNNDVTRAHGKPLIHTFAYNELDVQDYHLDAAANAWQMDLDSRNNPVLIKTPTGVLTELSYGRGNFLLSCKNPLLTLQWLPDPLYGYFGVVSQHIDGGGCTITYRYNNKWEVVAKQGVGGKHGEMTQIRASTVQKMVKPAAKGHLAQYVLCDMFTPVTVITPAIDIELDYIAGRLMAAKDNAQSINTHYSYDAGDRPISVTLSGFDGSLIHSASAMYNALGDETRIYNDSLLNALITYDENRNVRRKLFDVRDNGRELTSKIDHGFTYDRADRAVIIDGAFTEKGVQLLPDKGFEVTYLNHQRSCESRLLSDKSRETFDYTYWQSGELRSAQWRGSNLVTSYFYHPSGYQRSRQGSHQLYWRRYLKNTTDITTDAALFQTQEVDYTAVGHYYEQVITTLTPALDGRTITQQKTEDNNSQSNFSYGYHYEHVNFDSAQPSGVQGWTRTRDGQRAVSSSVTHDSHGTVNGKWGVFDDKPTGKSESPWLIWYVNGEDGTTYQKWYLYAEHRFWKPSISFLGIKNVYFYSPRGAYLGSYQNKLPSTLEGGAVAADLRYHMPTASGNLAQYFNGKGGGVSSHQATGKSQPGGVLTMAENIGKIMTLKTRTASYRHKNHHEDIEENWSFQDMTLGDGLSPVPQVVTVKSGDTYERLAQSIYGTMADASASLAESAGETSGMIPQVGSQVITPQFIPQSNKSTDQVPLSRVQQFIIGTLLPHLEFAEPSKKKGSCKETIVRVAIDIVALAIAYFTGGAGLSVALEAAAVAAASDAAMQEIAVDVGLLQSFSWQEVITTGIAAGMAAGFNSPAGTGGIDCQGGVAAKFFPEFFGKLAFGRLIQLLVFAGTVSIMDQLALIAAGKRQGFNVKELLVTIVEAGIAYEVGSQISIANAPQLTMTLNEITDDCIDAFVGRAIMGGSTDIEMAMAQAIGATIGNSIGDHIKVAHQTSTEVNSSEATHLGASKALTNMGPAADSTYYQATAAAKGVGASASAAPACDTNDLVLGGLSMDSHDFAMAVMSNSNIPVTSVNQQTVRLSARRAANTPAVTPPAQQVATAQSSMGGIQGVLNRLGERFENLVVYGKFNTNQEQASYIQSLAEAYKAGDRQFTAMLRNNSPVSGTIDVAEGLASSGTGLLGKRGIEIPAGTETALYHSVTSTSNGQRVLNGVNVAKLSSDSRFGSAFYLSANPDTTLAELAYHNSMGVNTIRYVFNRQSARILDLTQQPLAGILGYRKDAPYEIAQPIAQRAINAGFDAIRYPSARGLGANIAVFNNFEKLLTPRMIVPVPQKIIPEILEIDLTKNKLQ